MANKIKIEYGTESLKEMVLDLYKLPYEYFDAWFYLAEDGNPIFVIEQTKDIELDMTVVGNAPSAS